jgi:hypothetical protein
MNRLKVSTFVFATTIVALSGFAMAQDQSQGPKLAAGNSELVRPLSTRSSAQGQAVAVKLTDSIKTPGGVELPRGTELVGRVDEVKASDNNGPATLVLTFDQARLKDGKTLPIKATIAGFAPQDESVNLPASVSPDGGFDQLAPGPSGVALHSAVQDNASGTLTDEHSNFRFGAGTQFQVAVAVHSNQAAASAE